MAKFRVEDYFMKSRVSPSSLTQGQIIQFDYKSPEGVNDNQPLVYVHEKRIDRFYGINLHYDMNPFTEILERKNQEINSFLEEIYVKNPDNRKKLTEEHNNIFTKELIAPEEYREYMFRFQNRKLEEFLIAEPQMTYMRLYLYKRMNNVQKLVWKK